MSTKTMNARIQLKCDTEANWSKASNFTPIKGEIIIYSTDDSHRFCRLKVGDGATNVVNLPFIEAAAIDGKQIKIGTTAEWNSQLTFVPNRGDIILYTDKATLNNGTNVAGIKIGDGNAYCVDLPFVGDDIAEDLLSHINNTTVHITSEERTFWNNKINCEDNVADGILVLKRN